jgi:hypothetical protein
LDPTTARVFELLQNGARTREEILSKLPNDDSHSGETLFDLAIQELKKAELLDESASSAAATGINRREVLRKIALTGAAAAIIPTIVTLSPRETSAQTACLPKKACCNVDADCCSNKCDLSTSTGCTTGPTECH